MKSEKLSWRSFFWIRDETLQKRKMTSAATIQNIKFFMVEFKGASES
jgi:hypothetical protein